MSEEINQEENLEKIYAFAMELKQSGKSDEEIHKTLLEKGMDDESAKSIIDNINVALTAHAEADDDSGFPSWIIWIVVLVGVNVLSYIFNWPFYIY